MKTLGSFINGKHELNNSNGIISIKNPYDEKIKYTVEKSNIHQVEKSLKSDYKSFKSGIWSILDVRERSKELVGL